MLPESRTAIALVSNLISALARHSCLLTDRLLMAAYQWTISSGLSADSLLEKDVQLDLLRNVAGLQV
jgi:hypothetical protein